MKAIAVMKGGHITSGKLIVGKNISFESDNFMIKRFDDIDNFNQYKKFEDFKHLLGISLNKKDTKKLLKDMGIKDLYFYDDYSDHNNVSLFNKYWFRYINPRCKECVKKCKQSSRVNVLKCDDFKGE